MAIYKHVATDQWSTPQPQPPSDVSKPKHAPIEIEASDDAYEYFSDKDEAESHREKNRSENVPKHS